MRMILGAVLLLPLTTGLAAQRGSTIPALSPPYVSVAATPVTVTVAWKPVVGAASYTVETAASPAGPWTPMPLDPRAGTQVTAPTAAGNSFGGALYYYRVSALPPLGPRGEVSLTGPGVTVVPRVTPQLESPLGVVLRQDGADLRVSWAPVPHATGYLVTAALGSQLTPTYSTEVSGQSAEAVLVNVAWPNTLSKDVWVAVAARYGATGALSNAASMQWNLAGVQYCWPAASIVGPAPAVSITTVGPTRLSIATPGMLATTTRIRVERAPMGSATWEGVGCGAGQAVLDAGLAPGTQYQYRVSEIAPTGAVGQSLVMAATPAAPDSPIPAAIVGGCTAIGCQVSLTWRGSAGIEDYRIESSYGTYLTTQSWGAASVGGAQSQGLPLVPKGEHTFWLTPLLPPMRPSPNRPGQVTVVVP